MRGPKRERRAPSALAPPRSSPPRRHTTSSLRRGSGILHRGRSHVDTRMARPHRDCTAARRSVPHDSPSHRSAAHLVRPGRGASSSPKVEAAPGSWLALSPATQAPLMPRAPKKCADPGCTVRVVARTYCDAHTPKWKGRTASSRARRDPKQRARILARDPVCRCRGCKRCTPAGCTRPSTIDDHILNVARGGTDDDTNRQGLCAPCSDAKTQNEARIGRGLRPR